MAAVSSLIFTSVVDPFFFFFCNDFDSSLELCFGSHFGTDAVLCKQILELLVTEAAMASVTMKAVICACTTEPVTKTGKQHHEHVKRCFCPQWGGIFAARGIPPAACTLEASASQTQAVEAADIFANGAACCRSWFHQELAWDIHALNHLASFRTVEFGPQRIVANYIRGGLDCLKA